MKMRSIYTQYTSDTGWFLLFTSNLNSNNSQTKYLYMELFHVDDSNEAFSGFYRVKF